MGEVKRGWAVYDRVILDLWEKLSLWLRGVGAELGGTAHFRWEWSRRYHLVGLTQYLLPAGSWSDNDSQILALISRSGKAHSKGINTALSLCLLMA